MQHGPSRPVVFLSVMVVILELLGEHLLGSPPTLDDLERHLTSL